MTDKKFSREVLDKIKKDNIEPKPRWQFLLKDYMLWLLSAVALAAGSLAFSVVMYMMANSDWDLYQQAGGGFIEFTLAVLPYFWIIAMAVVAGAVYYNYRHTRKGYKRSWVKVVVAVAALSFGLGAAFYALGFGRAVEYTLAENVPSYRQMAEKRFVMWTKPETGLMAGRVIELKDGHFYIMDCFDREWRIDPVLDRHMRGEIVRVGAHLKMLGEQTGERTFKARQIRTFACGHMMPGKLDERKIKGMRIRK